MIADLLLRFFAAMLLAASMIGVLIGIYLLSQRGLILLRDKMGVEPSETGNT